MKANSDILERSELWKSCQVSKDVHPPMDQGSNEIGNVVYIRYYRTTLAYLTLWPLELPTGAVHRRRPLCHKDVNHDQRFDINAALYSSKFI